MGRAFMNRAFMNMVEILENLEELKPLLDQETIELITKFQESKSDDKKLRHYFENEISILSDNIDTLEIGAQASLGTDIKNKLEELKALFALKSIDDEIFKNFKDGIENFLSLYTTYFYNEALANPDKIKAQKIYKEGLYLNKQETVSELRKVAEEIIKKPKIKKNTIEYISEKYDEANKNLKEISQKLLEEKFSIENEKLEEKLKSIHIFYKERMDMLKKHLDEIINKSNLTIEDGYKLTELRINFILLRRETENLLKNFPNLSKDFLESYEDRASENNVFAFNEDQTKFAFNKEITIYNLLKKEVNDKLKKSSNENENEQEKLNKINELLDKIQEHKTELFVEIEKTDEKILKNKFIAGLKNNQFDKIITELETLLLSPEEDELELDTKEGFKKYFSQYKNTEDRQINKEIDKKIESLQERINTLIENITQETFFNYLLPEEKQDFLNSSIKHLKEMKNQFDAWASVDKHVRENPNDFPSLKDIQETQKQFNMAHDNLIQAEQNIKQFESEILHHNIKNRYQIYFEKLEKRNFYQSDNVELASKQLGELIEKHSFDKDIVEQINIKKQMHKQINHINQLIEEVKQKEEILKKVEKMINETPPAEKSQFAYTLKKVLDSNDSIEKKCEAVFNITQKSVSYIQNFLSIALTLTAQTTQATQKNKNALISFILNSALNETPQHMPAPKIPRKGIV